MTVNTTRAVPILVSRETVPVRNRIAVISHRLNPRELAVTNDTATRRTCDWVQQKTGKRVSILITPELGQALDTATSKRMHYVETAHGQPFSVKGFGAAVKRRESKAGLPDTRSLHGLRKADGVRMAEIGATENEIAARLGHTDSRSASVYTKGANQERLADAAVRRIIEQNEAECAPLKPVVRQFSGKKLIRTGSKMEGGGPGRT